MAKGTIEVVLKAVCRACSGYPKKCAHDCDVTDEQVKGMVRKLERRRALRTEEGIVSEDHCIDYLGGEAPEGARYTSDGVTASWAAAPTRAWLCEKCGEYIGITYVRHKRTCCTVCVGLRVRIKGLTTLVCCRACGHWSPWCWERQAWEQRMGKDEEGALIARDLARKVDAEYMGKGDDD